LNNKKFYLYVEVAALWSRCALTAMIVFELLLDILAGKFIVYDAVSFIGQTSEYQLSRVKGFWNDFKSGTIGTGYFPAYTVSVVEGKDEYELDMNSDFNTTAQTLTVKLTPSTFPDPDNAAQQNQAHLRLCRFENPDTFYDSSIELNPGKNVIGILVEGQKNTQWYWLGFNWVNVNRKEVTSTTTTTVEATTTTSSAATTTAGGDLTASACNATGVLSVRASAPRYRTENAIKYCVADLYVKNNGSEAVGVIGFNAKDNYWSGWAPYFLPGEETQLYQFWQACTDINRTDFNYQLEGDVPMITALMCIDPNGAEPCTGCFWIYTYVNTNNQLPGGMQTIDIGSLNPCTGKAP
jgi:hypothetical protein